MVQNNPVVGDIAGNTLLAIEQINNLSKNDEPDVIVFSEMFITGYPPEDLLFRDDFLLEVSNSKPKPKLNLPVVIMAGGKGTRLGEFTEILPKPLLVAIWTIFLYSFVTASSPARFEGAGKCVTA